MVSASLDLPVVKLGNPANARPAVLLHRSEVFQAFQINRDISSLLLGSLLADGVGLVDVVDASYFQVVRAGSSLVGHGDCEEGQQQNNKSHDC